MIKVSCQKKNDEDDISFKYYFNYFSSKKLRSHCILKIRNIILNEVFLTNDFSIIYIFLNLFIQYLFYCPLRSYSHNNIYN